MRPWVCPKCGRVWAGYVSQCAPCNHAVRSSNRYVRGPTYRERYSLEMTRR